MSRLQSLVFLLLLALLLLQTAPLPPAAAQASAGLEKVNCHKGESVNKALAKQPGAAALVVEIDGTCHENVVVTRDRVTLRGTDPATDGIQAVANADQSDAAVWVRGAQFVIIENLKLKGGFTGLTATDANLPFLRMLNCRVEGSAQFGVVLETSLLTAEDTTVGPNARFSVGAFAGSRFECRGCTIAHAPASPAFDTVFVSTGSQFFLFDSTLTGGSINASNSQVNVSDSTLQAFAALGASSVFAGASSQVNLTRTQVEGPMRFFGGTTASLAGVTQTPGSTPGPTPNFADEAAFVRVGAVPPFCASPPCAPAPPIQSSVLGFNLNNFANASLFPNTSVTGNINCTLGANAVCPGAVTVSGTANCGLCTKP